MAYDLDVNGGVTFEQEKDVYFNINNTAGFFKMKNASFATNAAITAVFPVSTLPFDSDDTAEEYLVIGDSPGTSQGAGVVLSDQPMTLNNGQPSRREWTSNSYTVPYEFPYDRFESYIRSRKRYQIITKLDDLSDRMANIYQGNLEINDTNAHFFENKKVMLLVNGALSFELNTFNPANGHAVFVAQTINLFEDGIYMDEGHGIFLANTINVGQTNEPLKIVGNMTTLRDHILVGMRRRDDSTRPSVFMVYDPSAYIDLIHLFSTNTYQWQQLTH